MSCRKYLDNVRHRTSCVSKIARHWRIPVISSGKIDFRVSLSSSWSSRPMVNGVGTPLRKCVDCGGKKAGNFPVAVQNGLRKEYNIMSTTVVKKPAVFEFSGRYIAMMVLTVLCDTLYKRLPGPHMQNCQTSK